jgi:hypothetical protein
MSEINRDLSSLTWGRLAADLWVQWKWFTSHQIWLKQDLLRWSIRRLLLPLPNSISSVSVFIHFSLMSFWHSGGQFVSLLYLTILLLLPILKHNVRIGTFIPLSFSFAHTELEKSHERKCIFTLSSQFNIYERLACMCNVGWAGGDAFK